MAKDSLPTRAAPHPRQLSVDALGVRFIWSLGLGGGFDKDNLEQGQAARQRLLATAEAPMRRQRRERLEYWDGMTYLEQTRLPEPVASSQEADVAEALIRMLAKEQVRDKTVMELSELPLIEHSRTRLRPYGESLSDPMFPPLPRRGPRPSSGHTHDQAFSSGIHRTVEVDMTALGIDPRAIYGDRLYVQAVLVQIYADLEIYYETNFLRVRKCQRRLCGAWFSANRMDGRGRFCSVTCRVASAREEARVTRGERSR